ncbi:hypothetical protein D5018_04170 [Parashewanella curva]|uniref:Uncharacterized protein n=1 Tax=Parashewanella curva TaxID=2338552 RepID=A0A3L8Q2I4_9GAMM|nr:hypothetical protein [Parashewanella curva]RLV61043.1 hypothetical protein D5018_04170 [Parashewanella curva]
MASVTVDSESCITNVTPLKVDRRTFGRCCLLKKEFEITTSEQQGLISVRRIRKFVRDETITPLTFSGTQSLCKRYFVSYLTKNCTQQEQLKTILNVPVLEREGVLEDLPSEFKESLIPELAKEMLRQELITDFKVLIPRLSQKQLVDCWPQASNQQLQNILLDTLVQVIDEQEQITTGDGGRTLYYELGKEPLSEICSVGLKRQLAIKLFNNKQLGYARMLFNNVDKEMCKAGLPAKVLFRLVSVNEPSELYCFFNSIDYESKSSMVNELLPNKRHLLIKDICNNQPLEEYKTLLILLIQNCTIENLKGLVPNLTAIGISAILSVIDCPNKRAQIILSLDHRLTEFCSLASSAEYITEFKEQLNSQPNLSQQWQQLTKKYLDWCTS